MSRLAQRAQANAALVPHVTSLPALPDPSSATVAAMHDACRAVEQWMDTTFSVSDLNETRRWVEAVERYLEAKDAQGPAQTTARLLEARIGEVLPEKFTRDQSLTAKERSEFRLMFERRELWESRLPLARRRVMRLIRDDEADTRPIPETPTELLSDLRFGDFFQVLADIPDGSVDLILTDPPYPAEFLPQWTALAKFAKAKLAPHGVLAAMSGQTHLPDVIQRLGEHLTYRWTMAYLMSGSANVVHARRVSTMWKPVLIYGSSDRRLHDVATSKAADKDFHGWGQSESGMYDLLRLLADPSAMVVDPFLGGGTTALVARAHGCHFIGAELDESVYRTAVGRLAQ